VKIAGYRVELKEEAVLSTIDGIALAAVFTEPGKDQLMLIGFVVQFSV
jgi:hypothetical protein